MCRIARRKIWFLVMLLPSVASANDSLLFDSLRYVDKIPDCLADITEQPDSNSVFWRIVRLKELAIQPLIDHLDDSISTTVTVREFGGYYTAGDIAFYALKHLIKDIPTLELLGAKRDENGCGDCVYWNHLRGDYKNRQKFRTRVQRWYAENKSYLVWRWNLWQVQPCAYENPNKGYYEVEKP